MVLMTRLQDSREEGREEGIVSSIRKMNQKGLDFHGIVDLLDLEELYVEKVIQTLTDNPKASDWEIVEFMNKIW